MCDERGVRLLRTQFGSASHEKQSQRDEFRGAQCGALSFFLLLLLLPPPASEQSILFPRDGRRRHTDCIQIARESLYHRSQVQKIIDDSLEVLLLSKCVSCF